MKLSINILFLSIILMFSSCITSKDNLGLEEKTSAETIVPADRNSYSVLNRTEGTAWNFKVWILFIPIGGGSDRGLYDRAYKHAVKGTDGLLLPHYTYKKVKVPLIVTTFVYKKAKVEGTTFVLKTDSEFQENTK